MNIIRPEVSRRFATARASRALTNPITGDVWVAGIWPPEIEERHARRALLAREYFDEYGPENAPELPLNSDEMSRLAKKDDFGLAVASFARSWELNDWDIRRHPDYQVYVAGLLSLPALWLAYGAFRDPIKLTVYYGAYPLAGLHANGIWHPVH
jgi:hypothetical protein